MKSPNYCICSGSKGPMKDGEKCASPDKISNNLKLNKIMATREDFSKNDGSAKPMKVGEKCVSTEKNNPAVAPAPVVSPTPSEPKQ